MELGAEFHGKVGLKPVTERMQHRAKHMPREAPVRPNFVHDFVQPDVGGLYGLVENIQAGGAHADLLASV